MQKNLKYSNYCYWIWPRNILVCIIIMTWTAKECKMKGRVSESTREIQATRICWNYWNGYHHCVACIHSENSFFHMACFILVIELKWKCCFFFFLHTLKSGNTFFFSYLIPYSFLSRNLCSTLLLYLPFRWPKPIIWNIWIWRRKNIVHSLIFAK